LFDRASRTTTANVRATLPADGHVHTEYSWDAPYTSMELACRRAFDLGLPSIAFTDHADFTRRRIAAAVQPPDWQQRMVTERLLSPPSLRSALYMRSLDLCRQKFPGLRILGGVELGEPHWHEDLVTDLLDGDPFERVLASMHTLPAGDQPATVDAVFCTLRPEDVVRRYLQEVLDMVNRFDRFHVLAHIDYAARFWPERTAQYRVTDFEDEYRAVLALLAAKGKALEINTRLKPSLDILRWWRQEKGETVTFGSDAHRPDQVARRFDEAVGLAEAAGFAPGSNIHEPWRRR
jgi:histidinol-phosphatase (PHP family)